MYVCDLRLSSLWPGASQHADYELVTADVLTVWMYCVRICHGNATTCKFKQPTQTDPRGANVSISCPSTDQLKCATGDEYSGR
jgi:hypothetical protein